MASALRWPSVLGAIGIVLVPHAIDPALQHGRKRPPPDGKHEDDGLVAIQSRHFPAHGIAVDLVLSSQVRFIFRHQQRVEALAIEIGDFGLVSGLIEAGGD